MEIGFRRHFASKNPLLSRQSERRLTVFALAWLFGAIAWGHLVQALGWQFEDCSFCVWLGSQVPSIHALSVGHIDPNAMRFVMVFNVLAAPVFLFLLFRFASRFRHYRMPFLGYFFIFLFILTLGYVAIIGVEYGGPDSASGWMRCHYESLACSTAGGAAPWAGVMILLHHLYFTTVMRILAAFGHAKNPREEATRAREEVIEP